jgi:hypothetical protein
LFKKCETKRSKPPTRTPTRKQHAIRPAQGALEACVAARPEGGERRMPGKDSTRDDLG